MSASGWGLTINDEMVKKRGMVLQYALFSYRYGFVGYRLSVILLNMPS